MLSPAAVATNDGLSMPNIGLGTYSLNGLRGAIAVSQAVQSGYRLLDTALGYGNETAVGNGLRLSGVARNDVKVTTKLPGEDHGFDATLRSFEVSRANLGLEYVDLYLIHWPEPEQDRYVDSWRAMIRLQQDGLARSIGVSNFSPDQITRLIDETGVAPAVNQVELHIGLDQAELRTFHDAAGVVTEAYSPLRGGPALAERHDALRDIAADHGVDWNQVILRWILQLGAVPIPRSTDASRQKSNLDVFGFQLHDDEIRRLSALPA